MFCLSASQGAYSRLHIEIVAVGKFLRWEFPHGGDSLEAVVLAVCATREEAEQKLDLVRDCTTVTDAAKRLEVTLT